MKTLDYIVKKEPEIDLKEWFGFWKCYNIDLYEVKKDV